MKQLSVILLLIIFTFTSCSKNEGTGSTSSNFTIKYEIVCDKPIITTLFDQPFLPTIAYTNGTAQVETANTFTSGTTWSKTITVTDNRRPFIISFAAVDLALSSAGNVTGNIYINGVKKATATNPTTSAGNLNIGIVNMNYSVN